MSGPLVVLGDTLLDRDLDGRVERLAPDAPVPVVDEPDERCRPGGAGLAAALAARDGRREVVLITALADDPAGHELAKLLASAGVRVVDLGLSGPTPEKIRVRAEGRSLLRMDRGGEPGTVGLVRADGLRALALAGAVLVADYGRGLAAQPSVREALRRTSSRIPLVWDPHPRGAIPVAGARLATPNRAEAARLVPGVRGDSLAAVATRGRAVMERWRAAGVAVTLGAGGALLLGGTGPPLMVPARPAPGGDACGAGDSFAATAAMLLADGAVPSEAVVGAVAAASAFVAAGGAGSWKARGSAVQAGADHGVDGQSAAGAHEVAAGAIGWERAEAVLAAVRARNGTVVATGGCFDLVHAGHVATLRDARELGDCLIVCLNSDASVRRLKGPDRPLVGQADRAAVIASLACVDAVVVFDEATPEAALDRLRPDIFVKGGDHALSDLPEAALLASWGGQAVILPYLPDRSTTRLMKEVARRANH
jgi:rfaE bifunctional protein nucleotidyltransferase chain/domain/rfaE bifunctional protein kinase chain/domain